MISKSGLPQRGHFMYVWATSGTKWMASLVVGSSFCFWKSQVFPQARHLSVVFALVILNRVFLKLVGLSCLSANCRIGRSTCWSSPIFMSTSVISASFSLAAISDAALITASASAHSCMKKGLGAEPVKHFEKTAELLCDFFL